MTLDPGESQKSSGFRSLLIVAGVGTSLVAVGALCLMPAQKARPKPFVLPFTAADVTSMEGRGVSLRNGNERVQRTFQVPPAFWAETLAALSPAHKDDHPAKWKVYGELSLTLKDGSSYFIMFSEDEFAAGPTFDNRVYYRGADGDSLHRAIEEAYEASQKKK
jgi:hypothetical protein